MGVSYPIAQIANKFYYEACVGRQRAGESDFCFRQQTVERTLLLFQFDSM